MTLLIATLSKNRSQAMLEVEVSAFPRLVFSLRSGATLDLPCPADELSEWERLTTLATIARWFGLTELDAELRLRAATAPGNPTWAEMEASESDQGRDS